MKGGKGAEGGVFSFPKPFRNCSEFSEFSETCVSLFSESSEMPTKASEFGKEIGKFSHFAMILNSDRKLENLVIRHDRILPVVERNSPLLQEGVPCFGEPLVCHTAFAT